MAHTTEIESPQLAGSSVIANGAICGATATQHFLSLCYPSICLFLSLFFTKRERDPHPLPQRDHLRSEKRKKRREGSKEGGEIYTSSFISKGDRKCKCLSVECSVKCTVHRQFRRIAGGTGLVRSYASVRSRVTRAGRINGQQAVPFLSDHGYPVALVDRHGIEGPADLERGIPVDHGAHSRHGIAPIHGPVGHFERGDARRHCRRDNNRLDRWRGNVSIHASVV